jgi:hypothetical protein
MKYRMVVLALAGISAALAQDQTTPAPVKPADKTTAAAKKKPAAKTTTAAAKPAPVAAKPAPPTMKPLVIPPDAVLTPNGTYSYTDKAGKKWIYSKTPFGVSKIEDMGGAPSGFVTTPKEQLIKTTDAGDTVKFERQTPFGTTKWEKKKSEMTDEERGIFQTQHPESPKNQPE